MDISLESGAPAVATLQPGSHVYLHPTGTFETVRSYMPGVRGGLVLEGVPGFYEPEDVTTSLADLYVRYDPAGGSWQNAWPWVYFHGAVEDHVNKVWNVDGPGARCTVYGDYPDWCAPDLICSPQPLADVPEGRHPVTVYGRPACLYLWRDQGSSPIKHGLVVFEDDEPSVRYVERAFLERRSVL